MLLTFLAYGAGVLLAAGVTRSGVPTWWRHAVRAQIGATAVVLSFASAWRLELGPALVGIGALGLSVVVLGVVAGVTRRSSSGGSAALDTWAAMPNTSFWAVPIAGALGGPAATTVAVLADRLVALPTGVLIHLMRRDAPRPQGAATSWVDQAPLVAILAGFAAKLAGSPPSWTGTVLVVAGPVLALSGAALWMGSVRLLLRSLGSDTPRAARQRYVVLSATRIAVCGLVVGLAWGSDLAVVAALWAGSIPAFGPALATTLYGYPGQVPAVAARWGWLAGPAGLLVAVAAA